MADHGGEVYGGGSAVQPIQEPSEVPEVDVDSVCITVSIAYASEPGFGHRTHRVSVLAHDLQRDPLTDAALRVRVDQEREVGMGVDVNEPRSQSHPGQVDLLGPGRRDPSHFGDTITRDRNVQLHPGRARTVEHRSAAQDQVRLGSGADPRRDSGGILGGDPASDAASGKAEAQSSGRPGCTDQTTGSNEGATFQNEPLKTTLPHPPVRSSGRPPSFQAGALEASASARTAMMIVSTANTIWSRSTFSTSSEGRW